MIVQGLQATVTALTLACIAGCGSRDTRQIQKVSVPCTLAFNAGDCTGYTIQITGQIDGRANIVLTDLTPHTITGKVNWRQYNDYFRPELTLEYKPEAVTTGALTIDITFH